MPRPPRSTDRHSNASSEARSDLRARQMHTAQRLASGAAQEVRLIGGCWKRTPLPVPVSAGLRPTPARVRETLFNWLGQDLTGWRVLDAFAGSGALGLEAASRGAARVTLLERDATLVRSLRSVVDRLTGKASETSSQRIEVLHSDALSWMSGASEAFDVVFLDPPFEDGLFDSAMTSACCCVPEGGWVYVESPHELPGEESAQTSSQTSPRWRSELKRHRHGQAGAVHFHLFQRVASSG
jgi:16S rRNA (guanine966-N2)-methyltransferase